MLFGVFGPIRHDKDIDVLGKGITLVAVNGKRTYIRNAFDIGPDCRSRATKEVHVLRGEVVNDCDYAQFCVSRMFGGPGSTL